MLYINGEWRDGRLRPHLRVEEPGHRRGHRLGRRRRRRRRAGRGRRRRRRVRTVVGPHRLRTVGVPLPGAPAHARAPRGAGQAHDRGAGQADPHGPQRGGLRGRLPALVRRGGQAGLRRRPSRRRAPTSASSCCASRSASSARSRRGTTRCRCSPGRSRPRSPPAAPSCSSRRSRRRSSRSRCSRSSRRSALPEGVVNLVTTSDPETVGGELVTNPKVRKITFTGSTEVGKLHRATGRRAGEAVSAWSSAATRRSSCFDDADPVHAAKGAAAVKFLNTGQACICPNRLFVQRGIVERVRRHARATLPGAARPAAASTTASPSDR